MDFDEEMMDSMIAEEQAMMHDMENELYDSVSEFADSNNKTHNNNSNIISNAAVAVGDEENDSSYPKRDSESNPIDAIATRAKRSRRTLPAAAQQQQQQQQQSYQKFTFYTTKPDGIECIRVTGEDGERIWIPLKQQRRGDVESEQETDEHSVIKVIPKEEVELIELESANLAKFVENLRSQRELDQYHPGRQQRQSNVLWVDKYRPTSFLHLLSDEKVNRAALHWLKLWDNYVFGAANAHLKNQGLLAPTILSQRTAFEASAKAKNQKNQKNLGKYKVQHEPEMDADGRPGQKILLLHGPPGTGKTTLARIIAEHAGYKCMEINASDDRSAAILRTRISDSTGMQSMFGDSRPVCMILDEIDGATGGEGKGAIDMLVKMTTQGSSHENNNSSSTSTKHDSIPKLIRPVICICNDLYASSLKPLRNVAMMLHVDAPSSTRLVKRLKEICELEKYPADSAALAALVDIHVSDIRACLNALHFRKYTSESFDKDEADSLTHNASKDASSLRGFFPLWESIFQLPRAKSNVSLVKPKAHGGWAANRGSLLQLISAHSDSIDKIMEGCYENILKIRMTDPGMLKLVTCFEEFGHYDMFRTAVRQHQAFALMGNMVYSPLLLNLVAASPQKPQLSFPKMDAMLRQGQQQSSSVVNTLYSALPAELQQHYSPSILVADVLSPLQIIIAPSTLRTPNKLLMKAPEKALLHSVATVMSQFGLTYLEQPVYSTERNPTSAFHMDPPIEILTSFSLRQRTIQPKLPDEIRRLLARELSTQYLRNTPKSAAAASATTVTPVKVTKRKAENQPKNESKKQEGTAIVSVRKDIFGGVVQPSTKYAPAIALIEIPIRFKFHEGLTNAVRRPIKMSEIL